MLTHDHGLAEDLVQTALTKAWFAWSRIQTEGTGSGSSELSSGGGTARVHYTATPNGSIVLSSYVLAD